MAEVVRCSLYGILPGGERWSVNPCFHLITEPEVDFTQLNTIATAINALTIPTSVRILWSSSTSFSGVRLEARSSSGVLEALVDQPRGSTVSGSGGGALPFQTSAVVSLRTNRPGGSGRGRIYWPATGVALSASTLRPTGTTMSDALAGTKTLLSGIEAAIEITLGSTSLAVWSRTTLGTYGVTKMLIGDVLDTQRRRRDTVPESYVETSYP